MRQRTTERVIDLPGPTIEQLAAVRPPETNIDKENLDRIAALAWELQRKATMHLLPPYQSLDERQRESCRASVLRTVQALHLLGWIDTNA
jgi:hypothetical protein